MSINYTIMKKRLDIYGFAISFISSIVIMLIWYRPTAIVAYVALVGLIGSEFNHRMFSERLQRYGRLDSFLTKNMPGYTDLVKALLLRFSTNVFGGVLLSTLAILVFTGGVGIA